MNYNSKSKKCFDVLLNANNEEEIINVINNADVKFNTLKTSVTNYCIVYNKLEYESSLKDKLKIYSIYLKDLKKQNKNKQEEKIACDVIKKILKENLSVDKFCTDYNIDNNTFDKYLKIVSIVDRALYKSFKKFVKKEETNEKTNNDNITEKSIMVLCDILENGIMEDNNSRKIDIIDYYDYCNFSFNCLLNYADKMKLNYEKKELLRKFVTANKNYDKKNTNDIRQILSEKVILGDGYEVEESFKLSVMEKLKEKNIPINRKTYTLMFRRCINEVRNNVKKKIK